VNSIGIFGEGIAGLDLQVSYSTDGAVYTVLLSTTILKDGTSLFVFDTTVIAGYYQISFNGGSGFTAKIRNMMLGEYLEFERCLKAPYAPAPYNRITDFISGKGGDGQFLSRRKVSEGFATKIEMNMISSTWGRNQFQTFVEHAINKAYYFSWNPVDYPSEAIYGWTDEDIPLSYTGDQALMQSSWEIKR
jgi:hypothetical protein